MYICFKIVAVIVLIGSINFLQILDEDIHGREFHPKGLLQLITDHFLDFEGHLGEFDPIGADDVDVHFVAFSAFSGVDALHVILVFQEDLDFLNPRGSASRESNDSIARRSRFMGDVRDGVHGNVNAAIRSLLVNVHVNKRPEKGHGYYLTKCLLGQIWPRKRAIQSKVSLCDPYFSKRRRISRRAEFEKSREGSDSIESTSSSV